MSESAGGSEQHVDGEGGALDDQLQSEELDTHTAIDTSDGGYSAPPMLSYPAEAGGGASVHIEQDVEKNYGTVIGLLQETVRRMVDSHELPPKYIADCVRTFTRPSNIGEAQDKLKARHLVVLPGPRGRGRHTCAIWLLSEIGGLTVREVRREPGDSFVINDLAGERHAGWLLDLRGEGDQVQLNFGRTLITSSDLLATASSYLAVAVRSELWDQVKAGGEEAAVYLEPPIPTEIIRLRLTREEPALPQVAADMWLEYDEISRHLAPLSPPEAVEWSDAIRSEHFTHFRSDGVAIRTDELTEDILRDKAVNVVNAKNDWRENLLNWHRDHKDSRQRNFILTAAVLENSPAEDVFTSAEGLAKAFGEDNPHAPGLTGPGILELISEIGAHLSEVEGVCFNRTGYADAVLEYFWVDRMHLREPFIMWMNELSLGSRGAVVDVIVDRVGQYVLRWSIRRNKLDSLEKVIIAWARLKKLAPAAEALITLAGLDSSLGRAMRDRMLAWAKSDQEDMNPVKIIVARACSGPLGLIYPRVMLFRIGHLAATEDPSVAEAVKDAVRTLWDLPKARDGIRTEIVNWYASSNDAKRRAARRTFAALAGLTDDPSGGPLLLLTANPLQAKSLTDETRSFLIQGWRCVLDEPLVGEDVVHAFAEWMEAALDTEAMQIIIRDIFADAVYAPEDAVFNDRRYTTLSDLFYTWAPTTVEVAARAALREAFLYHVRTLDPLRHPIKLASEAIASDA
jgi:hypothetical protein